MEKLIKLFTSCFVAIVICATFTSCQGKKSAEVTGTNAKVTEVVDGNTVKLSNNLTVRLLGVKPTSDSKSYLEKNIKGKRVKLISDSHDTKKTYILGGKETVKAYVVVPSDKRLNSVNGHMIRIGMATYDAKSGARDSIFSDEPILKKLIPEEAMALLRPRVFMIKFPNGASGTGFYISSFGIALTNAHVLDESNYESAMVIPMDEDGNLDKYNSRKVGRVLAYGDENNPALDFTIFEVALNGQQSPFLPLYDKKATDGCKIYQLGCNLGMPAQLKDGIYSWTIDGIVYHSIMTNHGDSGSPIIDDYGRVIGLVRGGLRDPDSGGASSANIGVDIQTVRGWLDEHPDQQLGLLYGH